MDTSPLFRDIQDDALLVIAASEHNMDMYYLTGFFAPDPFVAVITKSEKTIIVGDLEYERAKVQARADRVIRLAELLDKNDPDAKTAGGSVRAAAAFMRAEKIGSVRVPATFPVAYADYLRKKKFELNYSLRRFIPQRSIKTAEEIEFIETAVSHTEIVVHEAIDLIRKSTVVDGILHLNNAVLTSEKLKNFITTRLFDRGYLALNTIIAGGDDSFDPHNQGHGPLPAGKPIIIDVFPHSMATRYFADMTRTVVKGTPDPHLEQMYQAVHDAQRNAVAAIAHGVAVRDVHAACCDLFTSRGFATGVINGTLQGFMHSTGHGVGLDIHEEPRIYSSDDQLESGNVVTVEPGLYYKEYGGVRIEDLVVVTDDGCRNLNHLEKNLVV